MRVLGAPRRLGLYSLFSAAHSAATHLQAQATLCLRKGHPSPAAERVSRGAEQHVHETEHMAFLGELGLGRSSKKVQAMKFHYRGGGGVRNNQRAASDYPEKLYCGTFSSLVDLRLLPRSTSCKCLLQQREIHAYTQLAPQKASATDVRAKHASVRTSCRQPVSLCGRRCGECSWCVWHLEPSAFWQPGFTSCSSWILPWTSFGGGGKSCSRAHLWESWVPWLGCWMQSVRSSLPTRSRSSFA